MTNLVHRLCGWATVLAGLIAGYAALAVNWSALPRPWKSELNYFVIAGFVGLSALGTLLEKIGDEWTARRDNTGQVPVATYAGLFLLAMIGLGLWWASR
ncbi:MAG: hypothetical protein J7521_23190 [Caulobacter sp.]|nr:hypothetical protein [Caulobacter sp.]